MGPEIKNAICIWYCEIFYRTWVINDGLIHNDWIGIDRERKHSQFHSYQPAFGDRPRISEIIVNMMIPRNVTNVIWNRYEAGGGTPAPPTIYTSIPMTAPKNDIRNPRIHAIANPT